MVSTESLNKERMSSYKELTQLNMSQITDVKSLCMSISNAERIKDVKNLLTIVPNEQWQQKQLQ